MPRHSPFATIRALRAPAAAVTAALLLVLAASCSRGPEWNVVLVTFDTTRADRIGDYGEGNRTPNLDALAAGGVRFATAYTSVPLTAPAHATLLTGKYPIAHGVRDNGLFVLGAEQQTLAELLKDAGWATGAAIGAFPLLGRFGFDQGFDHFDDDLTIAREDFQGRQVVEDDDLYFDDRPAGRVNAALLPWLREHADERFFLWAHYFDPHLPYRPRPPWDQLLIGDSYRAEIAYADGAFGALMRELETLGVRERTLVVFTADHGEGLGEHREMTHGTLLYDSTLRVPLIVDVPGSVEGRVVDDPVGLVDLLPTVLDLLELEIPEEVQGVSLAALMSGEGQLPDRPLYAETLGPRLAHRWGELRALISGRHKYIFGPRPELFNLAADPQELNNQVTEEPRLADALQRQLAAYLRDHAVGGLPGPGEIDDETRQRLVALGYLSTAAPVEGPIVDRLDPSGAPPQDRVVDINRLSRAKELLFEGRARAARVQIDKLLAESPSSPYYRELLAIAELTLGNMEQGLQILRQLRDDHPNPQVLADYARQAADALLDSGGDSALAHALASEGLALHPTAGGQHALARAARALGRHDEALAALQDALELDSGLVAARVDLALEQLRRGDRAAGEEELQRAMADYPFHSPTFLYYARLALEAQRFDEAVDNFRRSVELDPDNLAARLGLVTALARSGRGDEARTEAVELERQAPGSPEATTARQVAGEGSR